MNLSDNLKIIINLFNNYSVSRETRESHTRSNYKSISLKTNILNAKHNILWNEK